MQLCGLIELGFPTRPEALLVCAQPDLNRLQGVQRQSHSFPRLCFALVTVALFTAFAVDACYARALTPTIDEGIRIDLPLNAQLRVENRFGDVRVDVTKQKDVVVAATISGGTTRKSPVVIERRNDLLLISVVREEKETRVRVNLTLYIPETARAEIVTGEGTITSRGLSASLSLNTLSGNIRADVEPPLDADVIARSIEGRVFSQVGSDATSDSHTFRSRFGAGKQILRANSQRGEIVLRSLTGTVESDRAQTSAGIPRLRGAESGPPGAGLPANQSASEEVEEGDVIRVDTELVNMNFSVVDRGTNRGVAGLSQSDFKLFEDGAEQHILHFDSSAAPFDLVLVIDLSGSTREMVKLIRAAARRFVDAARPSDRIAIITFAGVPTVVSPLTLDRELLRQRVEAIDTMRGDTKLYDATDYVLSEVLKETKTARRTAIVMMSDGLDGSIPGVNSSNVTAAGSKLAYNDLLNKLREFDGVVYTLWLNTYYEALNPQDTQPEAFEMGHDRMRELAEAGGGVFYEVEQLEDLAGAYERVVTDLGTVYSLAYRPANKNRDGKWRAIRVAVGRNNAVARGKHGYYAN
jgi:VWFA-related protein